MDGERRFLQPGMTATLDIRTGRRRALDFLLDPIVKYANQGMTVR